MAVQEFTTEELATEEWKDIPGYEEIYQVSSIGRVKRIKPWQCRRTVGYCLSPAMDGNGYWHVILSNGSKATAKAWRVHRLVMLSFCGPPPPGKQVNHIDADRQNARLSNLEYVTPKENIQHAIRLGRLRTRTGPNPNLQGENSPQSKLTTADVIAIRQALLAGVTGKVLARRYQVSEMNITQIKLGHSWQHVTNHLEKLRQLGAWKTRHKSRRGLNA